VTGFIPIAALSTEISCHSKKTDNRWINNRQTDSQITTTHNASAADSLMVEA